MAWTEEQIRNARVIYRVGLELGASLRDIQVAISAAIVESGLRNLDYGDRDSIGMFQQRDAWGSREARLDPYQSARMFFLGGAGGQEGLLDIPNRDTRSVGDLAQDVQVSAYPDRYGQQAVAAGDLLGSISPGAAPQGPTGAPDTQGTPGTLGAVPGLAPAPPEAIRPPTEPSVMEVNGLGEVTADESGIGSLTFGEPFVDALSFDEASSHAAAARARGVQAQVRHISLPTLSDYGVGQAIIGGQSFYTPTATPAGGTTFTGSVEGHTPYELTQIDGKTVDYLTAAALSKASSEFGGDFSIMQGSHNPGGVAASGGTHDGGGVVDLSVSNGDWAGAVAALRKVGFAAWARNVPGAGQAGSGAHIHAVLIGNGQLSSQAQIQVQSYLNNDDGLAGSRADDGPRDWVNNRFVWEDALDGHEDQRRQILKGAKSYLGVPFKWGGEDYQGVDDMGLIRSVYQATGVQVPRLALQLPHEIDPTPIENAKVGDLISWGRGQRFGIYAGDGQVIYAPNPGASVQLDYVNQLGEAWAIPVPAVVRGLAYPPGGYPDPEPTRQPQATPYAAPAPSYSADATPRGYGTTPTPTPPAPAGKKDKGPGSAHVPADDGTGPQISG